MRHIEKLKKIFSCCGKTCVKNTNGKALDELLTLAENGELGGGGGSSSGVDYILHLSSNTDCYGSLSFYGESNSIPAGTYNFVIINKYGASFNADKNDLLSMGWSLDGDTVTFDSDFTSPSGDWQVNQHSIDCTIALVKK